MSRCRGIHRDTLKLRVQHRLRPRHKAAEGTVHKSIPIRILHVFLFEVGLLVVTLPFFTWYLEVSLWRAFVLDLSFVIFYLVYAFVFNWAYDCVFPLPKHA
ncbi:chlorhexidine efflux transporter [Pseudoroseomonas sp. WGS1072]|uniref:chlorhexidine efflux transporter n=1 Tax=Roseomonas sp. WGS1072 TaxID=3366816 RepID=UPI003BF13E6F